MVFEAQLADPGFAPGSGEKLGLELVVGHHPAGCVVEKGQHLPRPAVTVQLLHGCRLSEQRPVGPRRNKRFEGLRIPARRGEIPHEVSGAVDMGEQRVERIGGIAAKGPFRKQIGQYPARGPVEDIQGVCPGAYECIHRDDILPRTATDPSDRSDIAAVLAEEPDALPRSERFTHDRPTGGQAQDRTLRSSRHAVGCLQPQAPHLTRSEKFGKGDRIPFGEGIHRPPVRRPSAARTAGKEKGSHKEPVSHKREKGLHFSI